MTTAFVGVGVCYIVSGLGIRPAKMGGRVLLVSGGVATVLVAAFPQPVRGNSIAHTVVATLAFTALGAWPVAAARARTGVPLLARRPSAAATLTILGLLIWFVLEVHGSHRGLAERAAALAEALWPFLVIASAVASPSSRKADRKRSGHSPVLSESDPGDRPWNHYALGAVRNLKTAPAGSATVAKRP
jgi:hypothetical protein